MKQTNKEALKQTPKSTTFTRFDCYAFINFTYTLYKAFTTAGLLFLVFYFLIMPLRIIQTPKV